MALQSLVRSWWIACWTPTDDLDDLLQLGWRKPSDDLVHALRFERQIAAITVSDTLSAAAQRNDSSIPWVLHREHDAFGQTFQPLTAGARRHSPPCSLKREKCDGHQRRSQRCERLSRRGLTRTGVMLARYCAEVPLARSLIIAVTLVGALSYGVLKIVW